LIAGMKCRHSENTHYGFAGQKLEWCNVPTICFGISLLVSNAIHTVSWMLRFRKLIPFEQIMAWLAIMNDRR
jgi:hypothetical protein